MSLIDENGVMVVYSAESLTPGREKWPLSMQKWPPEGYRESSESAPTAVKTAQPFIQRMVKRK
jgi:hypothetical protein